MEKQTPTGSSTSAATTPNLTRLQQQQHFLRQLLQQQQNHQFHPQYQTQLQTQMQTEANPQMQRHGAGNPVEEEVKLVQQDITQVCDPDIERPFSSIEDAVSRLLPYNVVADFESEDDESARWQQWDQAMMIKMGEFTTKFEEQVRSFNAMCKDRSEGGFRTEERLMLEQALFQQEEEEELTRLKAEKVKSEMIQTRMMNQMQMMNQTLPPGAMRFDAHGMHGGDMMGSWGGGYVNGGNDVAGPSEGNFLNGENWGKHE